MSDEPIVVWASKLEHCGEKMDLQVLNSTEMVVQVGLHPKSAARGMRHPFGWSWQVVQQPLKQRAGGCEAVVWGNGLMGIRVQLYGWLAGWVEGVIWLAGWLDG